MCVAFRAKSEFCTSRGLLTAAWLYHSLFGWISKPMNASLAYAIFYTLLMYLIAYVMYRRGWFLRV
ncbi:MAG TPA: hypothetical protein VMZ52_16065 [Bryobacteraceae bacterium]|nr:hypothetical protein [Bryobacteraceae bacterium]